MAEADIDAIAAMPDGSSGWGAAMRGAAATLKTRQTSAQVQTIARQVKNEEWGFEILSHTSSGALAVNWTGGGAPNKRVLSAGFNITGLSETNAPGPAGSIRVGLIEVFNTHGSSSITVDLTSYGMAEVATIPAGESDIFMVFSTPALS